MIDGTLSFGTFIATPANRIAADAARHVAELPRGAYNPLVIVGGAESGKTHLLHAIANRALALRPESSPFLTTASDLASGAALPDQRTPLLLVDEVHLLLGASACRIVAEICSSAMAEGAQLVFALRGPVEGVGVPDELLDLLTAGLVVEIDPPVAESGGVSPSRVQLADGEPAAGIEEAGGTSSEEEGGADRAGGPGAASSTPSPSDHSADAGNGLFPLSLGDEFGSFLEDVSRVVAVAVENVPWRRQLAEAIALWEEREVRTDRLTAALESDAPPEVGKLLAGFERDAARLLEIRRTMGGEAAAHALDNPDRLEAAEAVFAAWLETTSASTPAETFRTVDPWFLDPDRFVLTAFDLEGRLPGDRL